MLARSVAERTLGAERHAARVLAARGALWLGDGPDVAAQIAQLDRMGAHGQAAKAAEATLRAGAAALADEASAATTYDDAVAAWRSLRLPLHLALCLAERQRFMPGHAGPGLDPGDEAEAILVGLGAAGVLDAVRRFAAVGVPARPGG